MAYDANHKYAHNYDPAIARYKMANAATTAQRQWIEADDRAQEIIDFLRGYPAERDAGFYCAVQWGIQRFGKPTDAMRDKMVAIIDERKAQAAEWAERDAKSEWIGNVGDRQEFTVTVKHWIEIVGQWGYTYINICRDADDNVVIYKGSQCWAKGAEVRCMAKIKSHEERDGVKQTVIQRPTKVTINGDAY